MKERLIQNYISKSMYFIFFRGDDNEDGKIMTDENDESIKISKDAYLKYLKYLGGWKFILLSQLSLISFVAI